MASLCDRVFSAIELALFYWLYYLLYLPTIAYRWFRKHYPDLTIKDLWEFYWQAFCSNNEYIFFYFGCLFFCTVMASWFFFSYLGLYGIFKLNLISLFLFWLSLIFTAKFILLLQKGKTIKLCSWTFVGLNSRVDLNFFIDTISFSFVFLTTTIALFVFIYAFSYFRHEPLVDRFLLFLLSFVVSMIFLVTAGNTIMLFLGWELIGLTSFCLINFWTTKTATLKSAFKAFTFNKISDFAMFMFLIISFSSFYTFDIETINIQAYGKQRYCIYMFGYPISCIELLSFVLLTAAFIKSAQIGAHLWLPDSMEAPVPASALIHSATLVSAGIYLILRFNFVFDLSYLGRILIPLVGSLTASYGGLCAAVQSDVKKTLAYSTISHCGFLMVLCATEVNEFTIIYLYIHGFFKAGVFMCIGNVLRMSKGYQDHRRMGSLAKYLPSDYYCCLGGLMNLAGLPFTFGFFMKHLLLITMSDNIYLYYFVLFNCAVGALSGLFYSYRLFYYTFLDFKKGNKNVYQRQRNIEAKLSHWDSRTVALDEKHYTKHVVKSKRFYRHGSRFDECAAWAIMSTHEYALDSCPFHFVCYYDFENQIELNWWQDIIYQILLKFFTWKRNIDDFIKMNFVYPVNLSGQYVIVNPNVWGRYVGKGSESYKNFRYQKQKPLYSTIQQKFFVNKELENSVEVGVTWKYRDVARSSHDFYTNSSLAGTFSIFSLFVCSHIIIFFFIKYLLFNNYVYSDFLNTTILSTYYCNTAMTAGFLLNLWHINYVALLLCCSLFFSRYRKVTYLCSLLFYMKYAILGSFSVYVFYFIIIM